MNGYPANFYVAIGQVTRIASRGDAPTYDAALVPLAGGYGDFRFTDLSPTREHQTAVAIPAPVGSLVIIANYAPPDGGTVVSQIIVFGEVFAEAECPGSGFAPGVIRALIGGRMA